MVTPAHAACQSVGRSPDAPPAVGVLPAAPPGVIAAPPLADPAADLPPLAVFRPAALTAPPRPAAPPAPAPAAPSVCGDEPHAIRVVTSRRPKRTGRATITGSYHERRTRLATLDAPSLALVRWRTRSCLSPRPVQIRRALSSAVPSVFEAVVPDSIWVTERPVWFRGVRLRAKTTFVRLSGDEFWVHRPCTRWEFAAP